MNPTSDLDPYILFHETGELNRYFFELYTFLYCQIALQILKAPKKQVVLAHDGRDRENVFVNSALKGIQRAGFDVLYLGIVPTPVVPFAILKSGADCGFMLTASHNPKEYFGIKIFDHNGLKLLPIHEDALSQKFFLTKNQKLPETTGSVKKLIHEIHNDYVSFIHTKFLPNAFNFSNINLVVDGANGAGGSFIYHIFSAYNFRSLEKTNVEPNDPINENCGAAHFENLSEISKKDVDHTFGKFKDFDFIQKLFEKAEKSTDIQLGNEFLLGVSLDGDADRCIGLLYNPEKSNFTVINGDKNAALIYKYFHKQLQINSDLIYTIECDPNIENIIDSQSSKTFISAVGDKWLIRRIYYMNIESQKKLSPSLKVFGYEESGHFIFPMFLENKKLYLAGSGFVTALRFISAVSGLQHEYGKESIWRNLTNPYPEGVKKTFYVNYINKNMLIANADYRKSLIIQIGELLNKLYEKSNIRYNFVNITEDADTIYLAISQGGREGVVFIRNSGTEDKLGVYLRGATQLHDLLFTVANFVLKLLVKDVKNYAHQNNKILCGILIEIYKAKDLNKAAATIPDFKKWLDFAIQKDGLLTQKSRGEFEVTGLGKMFIKTYLSKNPSQQTGFGQIR